MAMMFGTPKHDLEKDEIEIKVCAECGSRVSVCMCSVDCKWDADYDRPDSSYEYWIYKLVRKVLPEKKIEC